MKYKYVEVSVADEPDASLSLRDIKEFVKLARRARVPDNYAVIVDGRGPVVIEAAVPLRDK